MEVDRVGAFAALSPPLLQAFPALPLPTSAAAHQPAQLKARTFPLNCDFLPLHAEPDALYSVSQPQKGILSGGQSPECRDAFIVC